MGKYRCMRKCKEIGEVAVMTRARAAASVSAEAGRKRKVSRGEELSCSSRSLVQLRRRRRLFVSTATTENSTEKAASSNSNDPYASCCSSNGSTEMDKDASNVDLEVNKFRLKKNLNCRFELKNLKFSMFRFC